ARFSDQYAEEQEPGYNVEEPVSATAIEQTKNPRQLLMLILKCYNCVSDDFLERIAPRIGIDKDTLKQMIRKMEELRLERDQVICSIRERIHNQFYRCIVYEKRLAAMPEDSACAMRMKAQLDRAWQRLASMRKRYAGMRPGATNGQVAQILGLTKGAVDANLYALKTKWNNDPHKSMLN
ncbi:MAG: hypothetical protein LBH97_02015, partial [Treponema sp.]|nr:hypothetical protein [Treponema sp.]